MLRDEALTLIQQSDPIKAYDLLTRALHANREDVSIWSQRGNVRRMLGDPWGALWDYSVALGKSPKNAPLHVNRGLTHLERGSPSEAFADLNAAIAFDATLVDAWVARSMAKLESGDLAGARADAQLARRLGPEHPMAAEALRLVERRER